MAKKKNITGQEPQSSENNKTQKIYITLEREGCAELIEKKSVFIGCAAPAANEAAALEFIKNVKARHTGASHNVYAYMIGQNITRFSDDGEPSGTAGIPVLDVIRKKGFCDAVIVVTRYFGGILLGAGGLVRAYSAAAAAAVEEAHIAEFVEYAELCIKCSYYDYGKVEYELPRLGAFVDGHEFGGEVRVFCAVRATDSEALTAAVMDMTAGKSAVLQTGTRLGKK